MQWVAVISGIMSALVTFSARAQDWTPVSADQVWMNLASDSAPFRIDTVEVRTLADHQLQRIRARLVDSGVIFMIQRSPTTIGISEASIDSVHASPSALAKFLGVVGEPSGHRRIRGADGLGGSIDYDGGRCRGAAVGLKANAEMGAYRMVVMAVSCGRLDELSAYLARMVATPARR